VRVAASVLVIAAGVALSAGGVAASTEVSQPVAGSPAFASFLASFDNVGTTHFVANATSSDGSPLAFVWSLQNVTCGFLVEPQARGNTNGYYHGASQQFPGGCPFSIESQTRVTVLVARAADLDASGTPRADAAYFTYSQVARAHDSTQTANLDPASTLNVVAGTLPPTPSPSPTSSPSSSPTTSSPGPAPAPSSSADRAGPVTPWQSSVATALVAPSTAFSSRLSVAINALIVVALVMFVTFPSLLFNQTYDQNHARIQAWWEQRLGWTRRLRRRTQRVSSSTRGTASFAAVVVVGALLGGLLDPGFGVNRRTATLVLGIVLAMVTGAVVSAVAVAVYRRLRGKPRHWELRALPTGLLVAGLCVFVSRLTGYLPGYLYGVIGGVAFAGALAKREEGHVVAASSAAILLTSIVSWLLWVPVTTRASQPGAGFAWALLQNFLAAVFVSGLVGLVIGLVPLRFLPGEKLATWHWGVWAGVFAVAAFALLQIMLRPESETTHVAAAPLWTTLGLFLAFGTASVAFWGYFRVRVRELPDAVQSV
jgi:hypothetical protein